MDWFLVTALIIVGPSTLVWAAVGAARRFRAPRRRSVRSRPTLTYRDVAVVIAARDEELVIGATLRAVTRIVPPRQVFLVSDASEDRTSAIARGLGVRVLDLSHNCGKACAIVAGIKHFRLTERFQVVMLLDADTHPAPNYLRSGLPLFDDPGVAAVAGRALTLHDATAAGRWSRLLLAYRERTYVAMQTLHKFGQAAAGANAVSIVPGFASMYRGSVIGEVDIAAPGLAIEDYNMTFEVHAKRLGRIAFNPAVARAFTQDPDELAAYVKQMSRWSLGFWQTLLRHRVQARLFWVSTSLFALEVALSSLLALLVVLVAVLAVAVGLVSFVLPWWGEIGSVAGAVPTLALVWGVLVPDALLSLYVAVATRSRRFLVWAPAFPLLRLVDAFICLRALARAVGGGSSGRWSSPPRRPVSGEVAGRPVLTDQAGQL